MIKFILQHISRGITLARNNPQIIYTLFLMIVIPFAFLLSGQKFLETSNANQERLEKQGIAYLQDTFVATAPDKLNDPAYFSNLVHSLKEQNANITEFTVSRIENGRPLVLASLDPVLPGKIDIENESVYKDFQGMMSDKSVIIPEIINGERHWRAYRGIVDVSGDTVGYVLTDFSMKNIDDVATAGIFSAYIFLAGIVLLIFVLLVRQARIIDYTVLYKRLKEVDQMKDDFLSMAAHELRTPLTIIRGYVELVSEVKNLDEKNLENLRRIDYSAKQLNILVGDILDVTRLEQGRMKFEFTNVAVNDMVKELTGSFDTVAKDKELTLAFEPGEGLPEISVDKDRLQQVLTNLIGNAVKYTPKGSVAVKTYFEPVTKRVSVRVSDTGLGISAEDQKRLFEKFYRVKTAETKDIQGTGLGLWITHRIVEEMKGTISVESIQGKGSDFIVSFPAIIN